MDHGARPHAKYGSSGAHRVLACPGQVAFCADLPPRPDGEASEEGTKAHEYLASRLLGDTAPADVTPEMVAGADVVIDYLEGLAIQHPGHLRPYVETTVIFPQGVVPDEDARGIADLMVWVDDTHELYAIEYKYGMVTVEPERNAQLLYNATAFAWGRPVSAIHCVVIQPRVTFHPAGIIRTWTCTGLDLVEFRADYEDAIEDAIHASEVAELYGTWETVLKPGAHCRYCPGEVVCPAREAQALSVAYDVPPPVDQLGMTGLVQPTTLDMTRVANILRGKDALSSWLKAAQDYADLMAKGHGVQVPGHKVVEVMDRRRWLPEPIFETARKLVALHPESKPEDWFEAPSLIGVTAAEAKAVKLARAAAPKGMKDKAAQKAKEDLAFLMLKSTSGNLSLVPDTDPRPAVNKAAAAFSHVKLIAPE